MSRASTFFTGHGSQSFTGTAQYFGGTSTDTHGAQRKNPVESGIWTAYTPRQAEARPEQQGTNVHSNGCFGRRADQTVPVVNKSAFHNENPRPREVKPHLLPAAGAGIHFDEIHAREGMELLLGAVGGRLEASYRCAGTVPP